MTKREKPPKHSLKQVIGNNIWMTKFVFKYAPTLIVYKIIRIPIAVLTTYINVNMVRWILDSVQANEEISSVVLLIVAISSFFIVTNVILAVFDRIVVPQKQINLSAHIRADIIRKVGAIDQINFQKSSFFDMYTRALDEVDYRAVHVLDTLESMITLIISYFLITGVTAEISGAFAAFGVCAAVIEMIMGTIIQKINYERSVAVTPDGRKREYIKRVTYQPEFSPDLKIYPKFKNLLLYKYRQATARFKEITLKFSKKIIVFHQSYQIPYVLFRQTFPWLVVAFLLFGNKISISEATVLTAAALTIPNTLSGFLDCLSILYPHSLYIENLRQVFTYPENIESDSDDKAELDTAEKMELKDVSFAYSEDAPTVLKGINMTVKKGEKIALVGYNGAGKSTLAKLMIRMFDCTAGSIEINGAPIESYNVRSIRSKIAYLSQDFKIYGFTVAENVLMRPVESEEDRVAVAGILEKVGLSEKVSKLKNGIDTYITREFDEEGEYFSGGELQKLSLARLYAGNYDIIIMDESTSALDPMSEDEIINTIFDIFRDKTVIMISHRLATIKYVDMVYFLSNGEIKEHGSHHRLMEQNGEYAAFYLTQADKYDKETCRTAPAL